MADRQEGVVALGDLFGPPDPSLKTRADLDAQLALIRGAGADDLVLMGRALAPWHVRWANDNGVAVQQDSDAPLGVLYLMNRAAIDEGLYDTTR